jgi:hypothetical protein
MTEAGSYIAGVPPMDGTDDEFRTAAFVSIPSVTAAVSRAMGGGAKITVLTEGTAFDPDPDARPRDESELVAATVAGAARKTGARTPSFDTWDDDPVNVYDPKSPVWDRLAEATGDLDVARAAIAVRMLAVGATVEDLTGVGILDERSALRFEELTGRGVPRKVTDPIRADLRRLVYPHEQGDDPTVVSAVSALYDSMRASNLLRKAHEAERDGGVVIAVVPPWMGYALKPVIARQNSRERDRRKQASLDLEMAWGRNARIAAKINEIMSGISPKVVSGARSVTPKLKRADPNNAMWTYTVPGSKDETYTVKVKGLPKGNLRAVSKMDVLVSCSCPFFRYQGPEHWAKVGDYLYGRPTGTATRPDQRDPDGRNRACKHVAAVFQRAGNMFYTPPKGRTASYVAVRRFFPDVVSPLFHATTGPRAGQIAFREQGIRADSGFSNFGGQAGISFSRDLAFLLTGAFGRHIFVVDAAEVGRRYRVEPVQHRDAPDEREERVYAPVIPTGMIRGLIVNTRLLPFEVAELAGLPFPVVHRDRQGAWVAAAP